MGRAVGVGAGGLVGAGGTAVAVGRGGGGGAAHAPRTSATRNTAEKRPTSFARFCRVPSRNLPKEVRPIEVRAQSGLIGRTSWASSAIGPRNITSRTNDDGDCDHLFLSRCGRDEVDVEGVAVEGRRHWHFGQIARRHRR